ncbi:WhiB family transcriptional regulator [Streptomyces sp. NPDC005878]|uniref:WhiB family transcriptional regulator n=1 Tax=Streptomyces sp. NPDC005878 TaxID=3157077 RepID=UPI0033CD56D9
MDPMTLSPVTAREQLTDHPRYPYRGCAPDLDDPTRAAGNLALPVDAWGAPDTDGAEPQTERIARENAAVEVCLDCPVMVACLTYGTTVTSSGHLAEPHGILGGLRALERHRRLIAQRTAEPAPAPNVDEARTPQRLALLRALAAHSDDELVAYRARMDLRTSNWHRSALCGLLGLDKETATRFQLLAAARHHGLLPRHVRIRPDEPGPVAAAPTTDGIRQRRITATGPGQLPLPGYDTLRRTPPPTPPGARIPFPRRRLRMVAFHEQLTLPDPAFTPPVRLEVAA